MSLLAPWEIFAMSLVMKNGLKVTPDVKTGKMEIALIRDGKEICVTDIALSEASSAAALLLGAAANVADQTPAPPQNTLPVISIAPTGYSFGPSHITGCDNVVFFFGSSALGIAIHRDHMEAMGQQLIALGAKGAAQ